MLRKTKKVGTIELEEVETDDGLEINIVLTIPDNEEPENVRPRAQIWKLDLRKLSELGIAIRTW